MLEFKQSNICLLILILIFDSGTMVMYINCQQEKTRYFKWKIIHDRDWRKSNVSCAETFRIFCNNSVKPPLVIAVKLSALSKEHNTFV